MSGLQKEDFRIFEDGQEQPITHFNSERVPVSLGLVVDTSGSMEGEKWTNARQALNRFLYQLLDREDEVFLYRFDNQPELVEGWTLDRDRLANGLGRIRPRGAMSLYDAVSEAVPLAQSGRHRKKALLVVSDGNDTNSRTTIRDLKQSIRESEVLIYAIGIDSQGMATMGGLSVPPPMEDRLPDPGCRFRYRFRCPDAGRRSRRREHRSRQAVAASRRAVSTIASTFRPCARLRTTAVGAPRSFETGRDLEPRPAASRTNSASSPPGISRTGEA